MSFARASGEASGDFVGGGAMSGPDYSGRGQARRPAPLKFAGGSAAFRLVAFGLIVEVDVERLRERLRGDGRVHFAEEHAHDAALGALAARQLLSEREGERALLEDGVRLEEEQTCARV